VLEVVLIPVTVPIVEPVEWMRSGGVVLLLFSFFSQ